MHPHPHTRHETDTCVEDLRAALAENGITLPSLGVDLPTFASSLPPRHLIALGNCNQATARALISALRKAAAR